MRSVSLIAGFAFITSITLLTPAYARAARRATDTQRMVHDVAWSDVDTGDDSDDGEIIDLRQEAEEKKRAQAEAQIRSGRVTGWSMVLLGTAATAGGALLMLRSLNTVDSGSSPGDTFSTYFYGGTALTLVGTFVLGWGVRKLTFTEVAADAAEVELGAKKLLPTPSLGVAANGLWGSLQWKL